MEKKKKKENNRGWNRAPSKVRTKAKAKGLTLGLFRKDAMQLPLQNKKANGLKRGPGPEMNVVSSGWKMPLLLFWSTMPPYASCRMPRNGS
jgi:hypothetical protein